MGVSGQKASVGCGRGPWKQFQPQMLSRRDASGLVQAPKEGRPLRPVSPASSRKPALVSPYLELPWTPDTVCLTLSTT